MNILMISLDKGLLGKGQLGDVVERHIEYGKNVESLDIIVFAKHGHENFTLSTNVKAYPTNSRKKFFYPFDALRIAKTLFQKKKYDLIVTQDPFLTGFVGYKLKKNFGAKLLVHMHGDFFNNPSFLKENWKNYFFLPLAKKIIFKADGIRSMSEGIKEKLISFGVSEKIIRIISTPVDIQKFQNLNPARVNAIKQEFNNKKIVLFSGRLETVKDIPTLLLAYREAHEKYPNSVMIIIGGGSQEDTLKAICMQKEIEVYFLGQKTHEEIISYYYACDVVVLTSLSESFGKVLIEANACGKCVISTVTTGAHDIIIHGENGFLAPIGSIPSLAKILIYVFEHPQECERMGMRGREMALERYDGRNNTKKIIEFWTSIINNTL